MTYFGYFAFLSLLWEGGGGSGQRTMFILGSLESV